MLAECREAWDDLSAFREGRDRFKAFAFGRQWTDSVLTPEGRMVSEGALAASRGRLPMTNNLIRQMLKQVVGRWRYLREEKGAEARSTDETDARALEEFLISGVAIQRVSGREVRNVSPGKVFFHRFLEADGSDCAMLGMLHDMSRGEALRRFARGSVERAAEICGDYAGAAGSGAGVEFTESGLRGRWRVVEVWRRLSVPQMLCHDREAGECVRRDYTDESYEEVKRENALRAKSGKGKIGVRLQMTERWEEVWLTPGGGVLKRRGGGKFPFAMRFYPMIDGEVHSLVEDVIGQQKYVNRLVMLLDDMVAASAKGVLLFPADQLPEGMTWRELRRAWENPRGVIPFKRTSKNVIPQQITTPGTQTGASEMLRMQLDLFDEIAGVSSTLRGSRSAGAGADTLRLELEQSTIAMLDLLKVFDKFRADRDAMINFNEEKRDEREDDETETAAGGE